MRIIPLLLFGAMLTASAAAERRASLDDVLSLNRKASADAVHTICVDLDMVEGDTQLTARYVASRDERMRIPGRPVSMCSEKRRHSDGAVLQTVIPTDVEPSPAIDRDALLP